MGFTKYTFNQSGVSANAADVKAWLEANASEYFDSVEIDTLAGAGYPNITCKKGDTAKLEFKVVNRNQSSGVDYVSLSVTLATGTTQTVKGLGSSGSAYVYVKYALKSSGGIMLYMSNDNLIFITKSNAGGTAVCAKWLSYDFSTKIKHISADLNNSVSVNIQDMSSKVEQQELTALLPLVFPTGTYSPALFLTPYTQYKGYTGIIDVDGTKYAYDGYVALSE